MCFSKEMSATFAALGLIAAWWVWTRTSNKQLASGVFYFFVMELLQAIQYFFIAPNINSPICDTAINQFLTIFGFLHICLQPYFVQVINGSVTKDPKYIDRFVVIKRLCLIGN
jgi:FtsH-binding integral membrane protein